MGRGPSFGKRCGYCQSMSDKEGAGTPLQPVTAAVAMPAEGKVVFGNPRVLIKHHLWIDWSWIAVNHLKLAQVAREHAVTRMRSGEKWGPQMAEETQAAMVAISAAAHALDAIYGGLQGMAGVRRPGGDAARHCYIRTALTSAYKVDNAVSGHWKREFTWLFSLRDAAAHPSAMLKVPVPHPLLGNGSPEAAAYCIENARRAIDLLMEVLSVLVSPSVARSDDARVYGGEALVVHGKLCDALS